MSGFTDSLWFMLGVMAIMVAVAIRIARKSCEHKWAELDVIKVFEGGARPVERIYVLRCEHCGDIRKRRV